MVPTDQKADPPANNKTSPIWWPLTLGLPGLPESLTETSAVPSCPAASNLTCQPPSIHESIPYNKSLPTHIHCLLVPLSVEP